MKKKRKMDAQALLNEFSGFLNFKRCNLLLTVRGLCLKSETIFDKSFWSGSITKK